MKITTGRDLFVALAGLDHLLSGGMGKQLLSEGELSAVVATGDLAFVPDFTLLTSSELSSELFTAKAVGELLIQMGKHEGVIIDDEVHGFGVRVKRELSPALAALLNSFRECIGKVQLMHIDRLLDANLSSTVALVGGALYECQMPSQTLFN